MVLFTDVDQVLQEHFLNQNAPNSSFELLANTNSTIKFYILSGYTSGATTFTNAVIFEGGLPGIL